MSLARFYDGIRWKFITFFPVQNPIFSSVYGTCLSQQVWGVGPIGFPRYPGFRARIARLEIGFSHVLIRNVCWGHIAWKWQVCWVGDMSFHYLVDVSVSYRSENEVYEANLIELLGFCYWYIDSTVLIDCHKWLYFCNVRYSRNYRWSQKPNTILVHLVDQSFTTYSNLNTPQSPLRVNPSATLDTKQNKPL